MKHAREHLYGSVSSNKNIYVCAVVDMRHKPKGYQAARLFSDAKENNKEGHHLREYDMPRFIPESHIT